MEAQQKEHALSDQIQNEAVTTRSNSKTDEANTPTLKTSTYQLSNMCSRYHDDRVHFCREDTVDKLTPARMERQMKTYKWLDILMSAHFLPPGVACTALSHNPFTWRPL